MFIFHVSSHTRVYVPCLIPHTCLCSMSHPPQAFILNTSSFVKCLYSMPRPTHVFMLKTSSFVRCLRSLPPSPPHMHTHPVPHTSPYLRSMPHPSHACPCVTVPRSVHSLPHYRPVLSGDLSTVAQRPWQNRRDPERL